jgi:Putative peptidoglycan binding domain
VPRLIADDEEEMPRRRRKRARAAVAALENERGLLMRLLLRSPKDVIAGLLAFAAASAIITNALFLQAGRHPAPMFGSPAPIPAASLPQGNPLPRPRPAEAASTPEPRLADIRPAETRAVETKVPDSRSPDPMTNLVKATTAAPATTSNIARPPAPIPAAHGEAAAGPRRVAAVQRVLTEYGYGQLKPTGTVGSDTQAAIQKFERDHKMPPTGQVSDRLVRELAAMLGRPIE